MAQKNFTLPEIGEVIVAKRRGSRHIRLSLRPDGKIRVGIPPYLPYAAGLQFAQARKDWIIKHQAGQPAVMLKDGDLIGKSHRLRLVNGDKLSSRLKASELVISVPASTDMRRLQLTIVKASERALMKQAEHLLPQRLELLAARHNYAYKGLTVKKLTSRWGSCSSTKQITLNYFLMQLPWELIDYVILHELVHTKYMNHSRDFWDELTLRLPDAKARQKLIKRYKTAILSG